MALAGGTLLALVPAEATPAALSFWDKAQHAIGFLVLGLLGLWAWPQRGAWVLALLAVHGGLIEVLQANFTTTRQGEWMDWFADLLGLLVAGCVGLACRGWASRREFKRSRA
jgi:VanZ family protein